MSGFIQHLFSVLVRLGGFGLLALGVLDSSFLVMPLGNDLLVVGMTARQPARLLYYAAMATAGSVLGCLILDLVSRKGGEEGIEKHVPRKRLEFVKKKVKKNAAWALAFASLMPPPFPFTPFIIAAAALQYPRKKLLSVIAGARFARFSVDGALALLFGARILRWTQSPAVQYSILAIVVLSIAASVLSVYTWIKRSKRAVNRAVRSR